MQQSPRSTVVIWGIAAALAVLAGARLLGGGDPSAPPVRLDGAPDRSPAARASSTTDTDLWVHVAGAVKKPGVMRLPSGSRVAIAVKRAGGPSRRADLTLVNLAGQVQDGQQIVVPTRGAARVTGGAATASGELPEAQIHLSTATAEQLDAIDGIGPTLAERIVEYRDAHGGFRSMQELAEVEGIGEKRLATLRDALQP
jgi:competence protein ComEA